jgi:hypothetical protein
VLDLGSGNFGASRASDGSIALAQEWLSSLPTLSRYSFDVLASPTHQDLAVFRALPSPLRSAQANGVPEPGTLALSALAFGGLARPSPAPVCQRAQRRRLTLNFSSARAVCDSAPSVRKSAGEPLATN